MHFSHDENAESERYFGTVTGYETSCLRDHECPVWVDDVSTMYRVRILEISYLSVLFTDRLRS